ncbi:MAG: type IV pilus twitching motility protein PilT [Actinobacteria bacterium]|jgi:twitching motility protein PilT|nr:type IV pilus twitching motility protein PilT [Actinomycetota bacterium]
MLEVVDQGDLDRLLTLMAQWEGSDLHIKAGASPRMRIDGELRTLTDEDRFTPEETAALVDAIMPPQVAETFEKHHEADFAYSVAGVGRFRCNAFYQRSSAAIVLRRVRPNPGSAEELGLPPVVYELANEQRGLVLVTGPTGSGKTTTLATMIDHINRTRPCHIVTIEDPIEYLHRDQLAAVDQREVGFDTDSFSTAMRVVLRQDPDVILVGEMRDPETAYAALSAAETGHLVFTTLHTINVTETISRVVDFFPPYQQTQIRVALAGSIRGTVAQRLVRRADGTGRVPALEVMVANGRIRQCIVDPEITSDIEQIVADGEYYGMQTFDQSLAQLLQEGTITLQEALLVASNPHDLRVMLESRGLVATGNRW